MSLVTTHRRCSVDGCQNRYDASGYCKKHWARWRKHGDPSVVDKKGRKDTLAERFWPQVAVTANPDKCWEWQGCTSPQGYGRYSGAPAHRVAFALANGYAPTQFVLHSCDNPPCVNPNHLREGTVRDNTDDKVSRNRQRKGEAINTAKLTAAQVREIRSRYKSGAIQARLAREYAVSCTNLNRIVRHMIWKHV